VTPSRLFDTLKKRPVAPESMTVVVLRGGEGVDCVDVRVLLVIFILLAVFKCLAGPLDQDRCEQGLGTTLVAVLPIMLLTATSI
jgi:amino acid permease